MKELLNTLAAGDVNIADCKVTRMDIEYSSNKLYAQLSLAFQSSWGDEVIMRSIAEDFLLILVNYMVQENIEEYKEVLLAEIHPGWIRFLIEALQDHKEGKIVYNPERLETIELFGELILVVNNEDIKRVMKDLKLYVPVYSNIENVVVAMVAIN